MTPNALLAAAILVVTATAANAQQSAPLLVTATVVSTCSVKVPRQAKRSELHTTSIDIACARSNRADPHVRRPAPTQSHNDHALVVINF
jgi:hypothetical protein